MRLRIKIALNFLCKFIVLPFAIVCKLEEKLLPKNSECVFNLCSQLMALLPGLPGSFLRRAFYIQTLTACSDHCHIGFGTVFSHRKSTVEDYVFIGRYALIGSVNLGEQSLIGSRVSILSGTAQHELDENQHWTSFSLEKMNTITIGRNVWVGEGAIIAADVGKGSMIGAGAVITTKVKDKVMVVGNPARFVKNLDSKNEPEASHESAAAL